MELLAQATDYTKHLGADPQARRPGQHRGHHGSAGLGSLPDLSSPGSDAVAALQPLEDTVQALQQIRAAIPV
jgi:hypothetical protein